MLTNKLDSLREPTYKKTIKYVLEVFDEPLVSNTRCGTRSNL